jgi:ribonuclease D
VRAALEIPKDDLPRIPRYRPVANGNGAAVDLLKVLLKMICQKNGVASKIIATIDDLEAIAGDDSADVPALTGWRRELFGETALKLKHGHIALAVKNNHVVTIEK